MADNRLHDASWDLVNSVREANQTVANTLVTVLDRNLEEMMLERGCTLTIPRSIAGCSGMRLNWRSNAAPIST
jgi:hypothetical protein